MSAAVTVIIRGIPYTIVSTRRMDALGARFYGRTLFTLRGQDGSLWRYLGKRITGNVRLSPVDDESASQSPTVDVPPAPRMYRD